MTDSFISIRGLSKHFGSVKAVDAVSFDIARGEFFSLLGPSGCGKTTLMRMIAGFEEATAGDILLEGERLGDTPPHMRPVNMVFQNYAIFPHLTVAQNIAFGLRKERLSRSERRRRVDEALAMIKLEGYGGRGATQLSGGQRQRVALARALVKRPKVLLLDEPLGALDKKLREQMQLELRALQKSVGITFVFVTHDQEEAMTMSDRIAVMSDGQALEVGEPAVLYEHPQTTFVADFLGSMNFLDGTVLEVADGRASVGTRGLGVVEATIRNVRPMPGEALKVAIRPENIAVSSEGIASEPNMTCGHVGKTAFLGDRAHVYIDVEECDTQIFSLVQNLGGSASRIGRQREKVWLRWSPDDVILLRDTMAA